LGHFAIDLVIFDSKIVIDSVTCIPLVPVPPATITIPDGRRAGESREIPYNEIPLFGRLTMYDQLEPHQAEPGKQTIALKFTAQDAPVLVATPLRDPYAGRLFGPHIERRSGGDIAVTGQDPPVGWELDYARGVLDNPLHRGELMVNLERLQQPSWPSAASAVTQLTRNFAGGGRKYTARRWRLRSTSAGIPIGGSNVPSGRSFSDFLT
jgi:hypothetical protein